MNTTLHRQGQAHHSQPPSQYHINQLLSTAATGAGIVGDVEALLTPVHAIAPPEIASAPAMVRTEQKPERNLWHTDEIQQMLNIMRDINALELLNDKNIKSDIIFRKVERIMQRRGYCKKTSMQIWTKWKFLKSTYTTNRRNATIPKMIAPQIFKTLHKMLCNHVPVRKGRIPGSATGGGPPSSECGNSLDGECSSGATGMVISGVEGGYTNVENGSEADAAEGCNDFDMPHPIFGFRLGMVKAEPVDTGYETNTENGTVGNSPVGQDFLDESQVNDGCDLAHSVPLRHDPLAQLPNVRRSQRRLNTTPTHTPTPPPLELLSPLDRVVATPTPPPPLRIANFAKEIRPLPPLSLQPLMKRSSHINKHSVSDYNGSGKTPGRKTLLRAALAPPPLTPQPSVMPIRLPKDITVHATRSTNHRMHSECILPNSPPQFNNFNRRFNTQMESAFYAEHMPGTSHHSQQIFATRDEETPSTLPKTKRKRRLDISWQESAIPKTGFQNQNSYEAAQYFQPPNGYARGHLLPQQSNGRPPTSQNTPQFDSALKDLSLSLRQMQRDMLKEFFDTQMMLAQKEHEFQMQQDFMLMQAFQDQTQKILKTAQQMLGVQPTEAMGRTSIDEKVPPPMDDTDEHMLDQEEDAEAMVQGISKEVFKNVEAQLDAENVLNESEHDKDQNQEYHDDDVPNGVNRSSAIAELDDRSQDFCGSPEDETYLEGYQLDNEIADTTDDDNGTAVEENQTSHNGENDTDASSSREVTDETMGDDEVGEVRTQERGDEASTESTDMTDFHGLSDFEMNLNEPKEAKVPNNAKKDKAMVIENETSQAQS